MRGIFVLTSMSWRAPKPMKMGLSNGYVVFFCEEKSRKPSWCGIVVDQEGTKGRRFFGGIAMATTPSTNLIRLVRPYPRLLLA